MARTVFTEALGAEVVRNRLAGAPLRVCAQAAGVAWPTCCDWIERGRRWNAGERGNLGDANYASFAEELDRAGAKHKLTLWARVTGATDAKATSNQVRAANLALHALDHIARASMVNDERRLMAARADVEENRANGTHVERVDVAMRDMTDEDILAEARRITAELEGELAPVARGEAPTAH